MGAGVCRSCSRGQEVSLRDQLKHAIEEGQSGEFAAMESLVAAEPRAIRHLLGMTYHPEPAKRDAAARGLALASRYHPKLVQEVVRRLVWAMNDESGTNALTAPRVIQAIAEEEPQLLLPLVPDLTRLAADPGLTDGLSTALKTVSQRCPGQVGERLSRSLRKRLGGNRRVR
jgi:hypothetical protein